MLAHMGLYEVFALFSPDQPATGSADVEGQIRLSKYINRLLCRFHRLGRQ